MTAFRLAGCAVALVPLLVGCGDKPENVEAAGGAYTEVGPAVALIARRDPPMADLPVPMGFELDEGRSRDMTAGGARWLDHLYKGRADKLAVSRFYERHMPISRWVLMSRMFVQGNRVLEFDKQAERCRIFITDGGLLRPCEVKVQMWPAGRIESLAGTRGTSKK